uniref:Ureidoglycolate hydrolase n=1 Tax=Setaria viridis TaxID=4556 RepID=A0A4V6D7D3_SETVI|nr:uncharacterized protein LOC117854958 isoform X2 [Setaria viridis]TKW17556.1 hypothetical protein SEVIR_5G375600v2 [Setaria viridis]
MPRLRSSWASSGPNLARSEPPETTCIFPHEIHHGPVKSNHNTRRFYIMKLENQPLKFSSITHHANVTQCLGSIGGQDWYLAVAKPSLVDGASELSGQETQDQDGSSRRSPCHWEEPVPSRAGHYYLPPDPAEVCAFRVSGLKFLKLHKGTWHAGPLFRADAMDFYNLELSNTNEAGRGNFCC